MELDASAFSLPVQRFLFLRLETCAQLPHLSLILIDKGFALASQVPLVKVVGFSQFFLVPFYDPLNLRLKAFDCLRPDLSDLLSFPLLAPDFLRSDPRVLILLQFN